MATLRTAIDRRVRIDTRSLAVIRIGLGCLLLVDLLHRARYIELFYTDSGVYPIAAYEAAYSGVTGISLHALSGALWYQMFLFVLAGVFAVAFVIGYRTRLVGAVSLILLFSLQARNPAVLNGGDRLFRVLFLVALVTPLGERWSVDALRRGTAKASARSAGTVALLIQPVIVFVSNAVLKHRGDTWYAGEALEIAMANDAMTILLGDVIAGHPTLLTAFTYGWIVLLAGSPLFLLGVTGRRRTLAVVAYLGAFLGMAATMTVGLFPLALMASVLPFFPGSFWDRIQRRIPASWAERRPSTAMLGPLARPPIEYRALETLRDRGHGSLVSSLRALCRSVLTVAGVLLLLWMLLFSASTVSGHEVPDAIDYPHLDQQRWGLYAPDPGTAYSWYVTEATLANGSTVDALEGGDVNFDRPPDTASTYETFRHRSYLQTVRSSADDTPGVVATSYADWVCREAVANHDAPIEQVTVYRMYQPIPLDGEYETPDRRTMIERDCRTV